MIIPYWLFVCLLLKDHAKGLQLRLLGIVHGAELQQICWKTANCKYQNIKKRVPSPGTHSSFSFVQCKFRRKLRIKSWEVYKLPLWESLDVTIRLFYMLCYMLVICPRKEGKAVHVNPALLLLHGQGKAFLCLKLKHICSSVCITGRYKLKIYQAFNVAVDHLKDYWTASWVKLF